MGPTSQSSHALPRRIPVEILCALAAFVVPFAIYVITLAPDIVFGDAGELASAAAGLGIGHPPGYPFAALLGQLFTLVPWASMAARVNLASAAAAAGASFFLFLFLKTVFLSIRAEERAAALSACAAALAFGFGRTFWNQAVITEVYAGALLTLTAFLYAGAMFWREADARWGYAAAFLGGLAFAAHFSSALVILPLAVYTAFRIRRRPAWRTIWLGAALALAGGFLYAYLPCRAVRSPAINWGDPRTLPALADVLTRRGLGGVNALRLAFLPHHLLELARQTWGEFTPAAVIAALAGVVVAVRQRARGFGFLAWLAFATGPIATALLVWSLRADQAQEIGVWFIPFFIPVVACVGLALFAGATAPKRWIRGAALAAALVVAFLPLITNYPANDFRRYFFARDYGANILRTAGYRGIVMLFKYDSAVFELMPPVKIDRLRPDLRFTSPCLGQFPGFEWYGRTRQAEGTAAAAEAEAAFEASILPQWKTSPVYYSGFRPGVLSYGYDLRQEGLLYKVAGSGAGLETDALPPIWGRYVERGYDALDAAPATPRRRADVWLRLAICNYRLRYAYQYLSAGRREEGLALALRAEPLAYDLYDPLANLGGIYLAHGDPRKAAALFDAAAKAVPRAGAGDEAFRYTYALALAGKASALEAAGDRAAAEAALTEALAACPPAAKPEIIARAGLSGAPQLGTK